MSSMIDIMIGREKMKALKMIGFILAILVVLRLFTGGTIEEGDLEKIAEQKAKEEIRANREIDKYKILNVAVLSNMNIINATTMGLPQDEVNMIEIEVEVSEGNFYKRN
jgi:hypothetical protein